MKLNLVLLALLPQALCAQQAIDPDELQAALQSKHLDLWVEGIAARRNVSKETVRSNVRAVIYHLEPASEDHHPGHAGGEHPKLERRQPEFRDYPEVLGYETQNDPMTNNRIMEFHTTCREKLQQPADSPFKPNHGIPSFWRAIGGTCVGKAVRAYCKLPNAYGPEHWNMNLGTNRRERVVKTCGEEEECEIFWAFNFSLERAVKWADCVKVETTQHEAVVNHVPDYWAQVLCPMSPGTRQEWDMYGYTPDGKPINWMLFTGMLRERPRYSESAAFMSSKIVEWRGKTPTISLG